MGQKVPPNKVINALPNSKKGFVHWNTPAEKQIALKESANAISEYAAIPRHAAQASFYQSFVNIAPSTNARSPFTRRDYEFFRPTEMLPKRQREVIEYCMAAYDRVGIIRNIIDAMSDFLCSGISVVHPVPQTQRFFRAWFEMVRGADRSERFANLLYRTGNPIVNRSMATITLGDEKRMKKAIGEDGVMPRPRKTNTREIPSGYTFLNPLMVAPLGGELALFLGKPSFGIKISSELKKQMSVTNKKEQDLIGAVPEDILKAVRTQKDPIIPLDPDNVTFYHYKKDDWQIWANPLCYAILEDLIILQKMKLADLTALDGAISSIRLWKLGDIANGIAPTANGALTLSNLLTNNTGGGSLDIIWDEAIEFQESSSDVYKFLGEAKYTPILNAIFAGLGIPSSLSGQGKAGGSSTNFVGLKTLIERLEYGRSVLKTFWDREFSIVQRAMGIARPAELTFDRMVLTDEVAEKALLVQLSDRNLISDETLQARFGEIPHIEKIRIRNEEKSRKKGMKPPKAGPWYAPEKDFDFKKLFITAGTVTPSEIGLDLEEKKQGEKTALDIKGAQAIKIKNTGIPQQGRPKNKKDSQKRKSKSLTPKPRTKANLDLNIWASEAQKAIATVVNAQLLNVYNKKNLRQLTKAEADTLEDKKFATLFSFAPLEKITEKKILRAFSKNTVIAPEIEEVYNTTVKDNPKMTMDGLRQLQLSLYIENCE